MLKMDSSTKSTVLPTWVILFLAFLMLVLCFHFLFANLSFSSAHNLSSSMYPNQSETTHQDDIVQLPELSSQITSNPVARINPVLLPVQINIFFPHFNPPNI